MRGGRPKGCASEDLGRGGLGWRWAQAPGEEGLRVLASHHRAPGAPGAPRCGARLPPSGGAQENAGGRPWAQTRCRFLPESRPRLPFPRSFAARLWDAAEAGSETGAERSGLARGTTTQSAPARKRWRRGGGTGKRFRGRGTRAGAAAGAAGTGLAPAAAAAAERAPRAGDVSAALSAGEARRPAAAGEARTEPAGPRAAPGRCPAPSGSGGAGASAPGQSGGPEGGRAARVGVRPGGVGGPGHLLGPGARSRGASRAGSGSPGAAGRAEGRVRPTARAPQPPPQASRDPLFPGPLPRGALRLCTGRPVG